VFRGGEHVSKWPQKFLGHYISLRATCDIGAVLDSLFRSTFLTISVSHGDSDLFSRAVRLNDPQPLVKSPQNDCRVVLVTSPKK
jgi:hypothetical protein